MRKKWPPYFLVLLHSTIRNPATKSCFLKKKFRCFTPILAHYDVYLCNIFFKPDFIEYGPKDTTSSQLQTHCHYVFNLGFTLIYRRKVVPTICFTKKMLKLLAEKRKQSLKPKGRLLLLLLLSTTTLVLNRKLQPHIFHLYWQMLRKFYRCV